MTFRWHGSQLDSIPLRYIKQIPSMNGVVTSLMDLPAGVLWPTEYTLTLKDEVNAAGLGMEVIESVNVHEDIKLGLLGRDAYIDNYWETVWRLGQAGVKVICYNFMSVFNWIRTDLAKPRPDGSTALAYDQAIVDRTTDPQASADQIQQGAGEFEMAGWEPERMAELERLFVQYRSASREDLSRNLKYFLEAVIPARERYGVRMAIHPDDPPRDIFGLLHIYTCREDMCRIMELVNSPYSGLTLCSGSLGSSPCDDIPALVREFGGEGHIHFAHVHDTKFTGPGRFKEAAHLSGNGSLDLYEIMEAYYDVGSDGYIRPDHGRMIWDEKGRASYGLYNQALDTSYLNGLWEAIQKSNTQRNGQNGAVTVQPDEKGYGI